MSEQEAIQWLQQLQQGAGVAAKNELRLRLAQVINDWLLTDFQKLVRTLYRLDVSEAKLKKLLEENRDRDAAAIIADLMIDRQLEKQQARQRFSSPKSDIPDDEKW